MANAVVTIRLMPESPDVDLGQLESVIKEQVSSFTGRQAEVRFEKRPVAFGLQALDVLFVMDEQIGSPDDLEASLVKITGVQSASVTDVRRALG